jgi:hypothetical protein
MYSMYYVQAFAVQQLCGSLVFPPMRLRTVETPRTVEISHQQMSQCIHGDTGVPTGTKGLRYNLPPPKTSLESLPTLDDGKTETTLCSDPVEEHVHGKYTSRCYPSMYCSFYTLAHNGPSIYIYLVRTYICTMYVRTDHACYPSARQ